MPEEHLSVLLVEDDEDDYLLTKDLLAEISSKKYDLEWVSDFEGGRLAMAEQRHDVYLVDYRLGPSNGLELLREAVQNNCPAPVILLTGLGTPEIDRAAMNAGAADYLVKGQITSDLLQRSITHSIQRKKTELKLRASEERLRQAQKLEAIGTLAGGIAHDFNNLLAIISGYSGRIRSLAPTRKDFTPSLDAIDQTVHRGASLVRQILTFARKTEFSLAYADVNTLLQELVRMLKETFPRTIRFHLEVDPNLRPLLADTSQLHQTFLNLCVNARDAMPNGGLITIRSREVPPPPSIRTSSSSSFAEIVVNDTGTGMDEMTKSRIFEPFFSTKLREGGTGLGLAVVYGIINHHGGSIEVDSSPGAGTTFRVYLPLATDVPAPSPLVSNVKNVSFQGCERIMFVEDEELLLELMKTLLEEQGYDVLAVHDGLEAVEIFAKRHQEIDLVVTDVGLPGLGGWEVFTRMRQIDPKAEVLLASGYMEPEMKNKFLQAGARDILQKPYVPNELFHKIRRALDGVQSTAPAQ